MKYFVLMFIVLSINSAQLFAWEQINTSNSPLKENYIPRLFLDTKGTMWIASGNNKYLYTYKNGVYNDLTSKLASFDVLDVKQMEEDTYGNLIFRTKRSISVFDGSNWYNIPQELYENLFKFTNSIYSYDDKLFVYASYMDKIFYFQYDTLGRKYNLRDTIPIDIPNLESSFMEGRVREIESKENSQDYLLGLTHKGLIEFNYKTKEWSFLKDDKGNPSTYLSNRTINRAHLINNVYFIQSMPDELIRVDTNNKIDIFILPNDEGFQCDFTDVYVLPNNQGTLVSKLCHLFYIDPYDKVYKISKPADMADENWLLYDIEFDGEKLWIGSFYGGIFKFTIDELLKDLIKVSVENPSYFPTVEVLNIFPNPANSTILNVEMALEEQTSDNLSLTIYNIDGEALGTPTILEQSTYKQYNKLKLEIPKLPSGIYFISFDNKKGLRTKSFVIE